MTSELTVYELRQYQVMPGRLDVALDRFQNHLPAIFARHGIRNVGRWTVATGSGGPGFAYLMAYSSLAERERVWTKFYADDEWWHVRAATQGDEEATERFDIHFLRANPKWVSAPVPAGHLRGTHDLIFAELALGKQAQANDWWHEIYLPALENLGARVMLVADFITGPALPRLAVMLAWTDAATRREGWLRLNADPAIADAMRIQRRDFGRSLTGKTDSWTLEPTPLLLPDESFAL